MLFFVFLIAIVLLCFMLGAVAGIKKADRGIKFFAEFVLITAFSLLIALRPEFIPDVASYNEIFYTVDVNAHYGFDFFGEYLSVEYGFLYLMKIFKIFCQNVYIFYFFLTFITVSVFVYGVKGVIYGLTKKHINVPYVMGAYFSYYGIYYNGIAIRQGLALSLCILALYFLIYKKYIRMAVSLVLAFLFHRLSILAVAVLLFYALFKKRGLTLKFYTAVCIICLIYYLYTAIMGTGGFIYDVAAQVVKLFGLSESYLGWLSDYSNIPAHISLTNLFICIQGFVLIYLCRYRKPMKLFCGIYVLGMIISVLFSNMSAACRLYDFFTIYSAIIIAYVLSDIQLIKKRIVGGDLNAYVVRYNTVNLFLVGVLIVCNIVLIVNIASHGV